MSETTTNAVTEPERVVFLGAEGNRLVADRVPAADPAAPVALLLHGGGQTRHAWKGTAERLAGLGLETIAVDLRGHGESQWVDSGRYRYRDFAGDLAAVVAEIRAAEPERGAPILVGASLGGIASWVAESEAPGTARAIVLVDIVPHMDPVGVDRIQTFMKANMREGFASLDEAADAVAAYQPHRARPRSHEGLRKNLRLDPDGRYRWHWDPAFMDGPHAVEGQSPEVENALAAAAAKLRCPLLLVRGALSDLVTPDRAEAFRRLVPQAEVVDVSSAAHMVVGDRNDVFAAAIADFIARL